MSSQETKKYELPAGWELIKLEKILLTAQSGFACPKKYEVSDGIPHLRPNNIGFWGKLDLSKLVRVPPEMVDLRKYCLRKGDVLFNNTNSKELVGRAALVQENLDYGFSNHITRLRVNERLVSPHWITIALNFLWFKGYFLKQCRKWIGQAGINTTMLKSIKVFLPPLEEQHRIVARIEQLLSKVEEARRLRRQAREEAEQIMQAALHKVFSRAEERGWELVELRDVLKEDRRMINPQEYGDKEVFLITMDCIESDTGRLLKVIKCNGGEIKSAKYVFNPNHILYGKLRPYLNKVYVPNNEGVCTTEFVPFTVVKAVKEYVAFYLRRKETVDFAINHITGTRQPRVVIKELLKYPIPLPSIEEQEKVVAYLNKIRETVESLIKLQQRTEEELEKLVPAILEKAFRGDL